MDMANTIRMTVFPRLTKLEQAVKALHGASPQAAVAGPSLAEFKSLMQTVASLEEQVASLQAQVSSLKQELGDLKAIE